jgi:pilus assembly protein CpaE
MFPVNAIETLPLTLFHNRSAMTELVHLVIVDSDEDARRYIREALKAIEPVRVEAEAADLGRVHDLVAQHKPDIVILDLFPSPDHALKLAERLSHSFPQIMLIVTSQDSDPETIRRAMRAGAREFLSKPVQRDELITAVRALLRILTRKTMSEGGGGKIISVFGPKGGAGVTTVAANLAVNMAERTKKDVILVDLNLQFGNAGVFLNLKPRHSLLDVALHVDEIEPDTLKHSLTRHSSGVYLLAGPQRIEDTESLTGAHFDRIISILRAIFDYVFIDLSRTFDEFTVRALDASDHILTVFTADIPSISNTLRCLDAFKRMEYSPEKVLPIVNRYTNSSSPALEELGKTMQYPLFWKIPNQDYATVINSINQGIPLSAAAPRSPASQSFIALAARLNGGWNSGKEAGKGEQKESFLHRLLQRK